MQAHGVSSLEAMLSLDTAADPRDAIELFIARALFDAGIWSSPRTSDGIPSYRVLEQGLTRVRVCGQIWQIDQTVHLFWLDIERRAAPESSTWTLHFDIDATSMSARRARQAFDVIQDPADITWVHTLAGRE
jgi:hypothetical protein